jgi:tellurite resistance protein
MTTDNTTEPTTVIATLPPCPAWCTEHPYSMDSSVMHSTTVAEGDWLDSGSPKNPVARGCLRLQQLESFDMNRREVTRDEMVLQFGQYAAEGSGVTFDECMDIRDPRAVAAALLNAAAVLDEITGASS